MNLPGMTSIPCALFFRSVPFGVLGYVAPTAAARSRLLIGHAISLAWAEERRKASPSVWMEPDLLIGAAVDAIYRRWLAHNRSPSHLGRLESMTIGLRDGQP